MANEAPKLTYDGHELPATWLVGEFALEVAAIESGELDETGASLRDATGRAWLTLPDARPHPVVDRSRPLDVPRLTHTVEVVSEVVHPETQLDITDALLFRPDARIGDSISIDFSVDRAQLAEIVSLRRGFVGWLDTDPPSARFPVEFRGATVDFGASPGIGIASRITADYSPGGAFRRPIEIVLGGFTVVVSTVRLTPKGARARAYVRLPASISDAASCQPAVIDLGTISLSPSSVYFIDAPADPFGPWLLGETGLVIEGTGYVLDLSPAASPPPHPPSWRGLQLHDGTASGRQHVPDPCNTGYLRGDYEFKEATIVASGFTGTLDLSSPVAFTALNPLGQAVELASGWLDVAQSRIAGGEFQNGWTELAPGAVWEGTGPVRLRLDTVAVQPDLDLDGVISDAGHKISWGELTRPGEEVVAFTAVTGLAFLFLPAGPFASYSPMATGTFSAPVVRAGQPALSLTQLDDHDASGVTFAGVEDLLVHSPDRPGGAGNPLVIGQVDGWLRVGTTGLDGELSTFSSLRKEEYGNPALPGYAGTVPFWAIVSYGDGENNQILAQFVTSAVTESHLNGYLEIPAPADLARLRFEDLKLTSTANLVGGDVSLAGGGVRLDHWDLQLVPTGPPHQAGVLSVRTGRILFLDAGIAEPVHFARPFGLTWGELLANGNLGQLFLDFNDWGQRFDGLVFHPDAFRLSPFVAGANPKLAVSGSIVFCYFGVAYVNIEDAALVTTGGSRPYQRWVEVPKSPVTPDSRPTDLTLSGVWHDVTAARLADFHCLDAHVDYHTIAQNGFLGTGGAQFGFLHSLDLDITVEIQAATTDIRISATSTHDLDLSTLGRLGTLNEIIGNVRIEGATIARLTMYGVFEQSAAGPSPPGIFGPKAGYAVETNLTVTATSLDIYVSGDMLVSLGITEVEASGTAHLLFDFAALTAEGELIGRVDCDAAVAGLSADGQLTWHLSPAIQYLQGRVRVQVFSLVGGQALEGGFFIGNNVPRALAWVLDTTDPHFRMSRAILPPRITGVYGYGFVSWGINLYVLGGGIDLFVGAGAFSAPVTGGLLPPTAGPLPYVVGACGVHAYGEILGGLVSASGWANLSLRGPIPPSFEGTLGLSGCVLWVMCASVTITVRLSSAGVLVF